jgi:rhodanese-related sulfurtransferase
MTQQTPQSANVGAGSSSGKLWQLVILLGVSAFLGLFLFRGNDGAVVSQAASTSFEEQAEVVVPLGEESNREIPVYEGSFSPDGFPLIAWKRVEELKNEFAALLVDARPDWSFAAGHIPGAVNLPFSFQTTEAESAFLETYGPDRLLVIYCGDPECERSKYLAIKLRDEFSFRNVWLYEGGYEDYLKQRGMLERE